METSDDTCAPGGGQVLSLRVAADPHALRGVRRDVRAWLDRLGIDPAVAYDLVFGLNEACTNAIEHPLDAADAHVDVEVRLERGVVVFSVRDSGRWRDVSRTRDRGRGLALMRAVADEVQLRTSSGGTEVRFCRRLAAA